jgi:hypothetical protein
MVSFLKNSDYFWYKLTGIAHAFFSKGFLQQIYNAEKIAIFSIFYKPEFFILFLELKSPACAPACSCARPFPRIKNYADMVDTH